MSGSVSNTHLALKAGIWYVVSNIMVKAITVLTTPIFTRLLSTEEYGVVQTFVSWHALLLPFFTLNLTYSIGRAKLDFPGSLKEYVGSILILTAFFSILLTACVIGFLGPVSRLFELPPWGTIALLIYLFAQLSILLAQGTYRYSYQYKQNIAIAWCSALSTTLCSLAFICFGRGDKALARMWGIALPTALMGLWFWTSAFRQKLLSIKPCYWKYGLRISVPLVFHTISMHILSQSDRIFIAKIWGASDTAFYSLAYTYGVLLHVFTTAVSQGWLPWFHDTYFQKKFPDIRRNVKPLILLGCYIGLASIALAPEAILVFGGARYAHSLPCVPPVVLGVICQYVYTHYVNIELHLKKTIFVSAGTVFAALFNIAANAFFIPRFGFVAAAYTTLASYFALMLVHFVITRKILCVHLYNDTFMFGTLVVVSLLSAALVASYSRPTLRMTFVVVGFITFLFQFRFHIGRWLFRRYPRHST